MIHECSLLKLGLHPCGLMKNIMLRSRIMEMSIVYNFLSLSEISWHQQRTSQSLSFFNFFFKTYTKTLDSTKESCLLQKVFWSRSKFKVHSLSWHYKIDKTMNTLILFCNINCLLTNHNKLRTLQQANIRLQASTSCLAVTAVCSSVLSGHIGNIFETDCYS